MVQGKVSDDDLRSAISVGNVPILLMVLVQLTGDLRWMEPPYAPSRTVGMDENDSGGLSPELQQEVRSAATAAILKWRSDGQVALDQPDPDMLVRMLSICIGEPIPEEIGPRISQTLSAAIHPEAQVHGPIAVPAGFQAVIIGAGFSGLCMAARLTEAGIPFVILEKESDIGGVWWTNGYPGAGVDTPSYLYSLTFVPYSWSRYFAGRDEVHQYLHYIADRFDLKRHIRLNSEVLRAEYQDASQTWQIDVRDGEGKTSQLQANVVVSGVGIFNPATIPNLPGLSSFRGPAVHTAEWPKEGLDLKGKKVAVVGNGASAVQAAPAIAQEAATLTIFQRSPHWIAPFPKFKQNIPEATTLLNEEVPFYRAWFRERLAWIFGDRTYPTLFKDPAWQFPERSLNARNEAVRRFFDKYLRQELGDREDLIEKSLPPFPPYAKRMLLDNGWLNALKRDNVTLETDALAEVVPDGVITSAGKKYELDAIVFATGFGVTRFLSTFDVVGKDGRALRDVWEEDNAQAYLGTTVPGFPNFFILYGPNVNGGGGSVLGHLESQVYYIIELLRQMVDADATAVECRPEVCEEFNQAVADRHDQIVYTLKGVNNYYSNSRGRVVVQNPFANVEYWRMTRSPKLSDYIIKEKGGEVRSAKAS